MLTCYYWEIYNKKQVLSSLFKLRGFYCCTSNYLRNINYSNNIASVSNCEIRLFIVEMGSPNFRHNLQTKAVHLIYNSMMDLTKASLSAMILVQIMWAGIWDLIRQEGGKKEKS